ncbi:hypothetical protein MJG53_018856 [Ovis ammon polii x Ovis aries]|uniref:Uncharacterized protein n=1 Tax=Ovis ammon polii x Ovis aries TaxID=2918886 RepID=A0ACB9U401_9CETA|nr:hypothetical protein MJG53_018856 [Ovis ammon polii x Ovis aries]
MQDDPWNLKPTITGLIKEESRRNERDAIKDGRTAEDKSMCSAAVAQASVAPRYVKSSRSRDQTHLLGCQQGPDFELSHVGPSKRMSFLEYSPLYAFGVRIKHLEGQMLSDEGGNGQSGPSKTLPPKSNNLPPLFHQQMAIISTSLPLIIALTHELQQSAGKYYVENVSLQLYDQIKPSGGRFLKFDLGHQFLSTLSTLSDKKSEDRAVGGIEVCAEGPAYLEGLNISWGREKNIKLLKSFDPLDPLFHIGGELCLLVLSSPSVPPGVEAWNLHHWTNGFNPPWIESNDHISFAGLK